MGLGSGVGGGGVTRLRSCGAVRQQSSGEVGLLGSDLRVKSGEAKTELWSRGGAWARVGAGCGGLDMWGLGNPKL